MKWIKTKTILDHLYIQFIIAWKCWICLKRFLINLLDFTGQSCSRAQKSCYYEPRSGGSWAWHVFNSLRYPFNTCSSGAGHHLLWGEGLGVRAKGGMEDFGCVTWSLHKALLYFLIPLLISSQFFYSPLNHHQQSIAGDVDLETVKCCRHIDALQVQRVSSTIYCNGCI